MVGTLWDASYVRKLLSIEQGGIYTIRDTRQTAWKMSGFMCGWNVLGGDGSDQERKSISHVHKGCIYFVGVLSGFFDYSH
jgi:hypothetical protein